MSKERELLKRWFNDIGIIQADIKLLRDTQALLTKPEQKPEQEPVGYLYKQIDCTGEWSTIFKVDKPYITRHEIKDIVPLYTAPPKREPLSSIKILELTSKHEYAINLIRAVEKAHGIGGGE